jgi:hypothetical protein
MIPPNPDRLISPRLAELGATGLALLDDRARGELAAFVTASRTPDGGVRGRGAGSDLYYAPFGLALARWLGIGPTPAERAYLSQFGTGSELDVVHWAALTRARGFLDAEPGSKAWTADAAAVQSLELRAREAESGGPYAAFLVMLAAEALGVVPPMAGLAESVERHRAEDGSYRAATAGAGTVPVTAAAITVLFAAARPVPAEATGFLESMHHASGGWAASRDAPEPDLLSSAVALFALRLAGRPPPDDPMPAIRFIESHWRPDGGCSGHRNDPAADAEYTWYALLALGALLPS